MYFSSRTRKRSGQDLLLSQPTSLPLSLSLSLTACFSTFAFVDAYVCTNPKERVPRDYSETIDQKSSHCDPRREIKNEFRVDPVGKYRESRSLEEREDSWLPRRGTTRGKVNGTARAPFHFYSALENPILRVRQLHHISTWMPGNVVAR